MSSLRGFPTQQKLVTNQSSKNEFVTVQPSDNNLRNNLDTVARYCFRVGNPAVAILAGGNTGNPADGSGTFIDDTSDVARIGDFVRFEDGGAKWLEIPIVEITPGVGFKLGARLNPAPAAADTFFILRYLTQRSNSDGTALISSGPTTFVKDTVISTVNEDTAIPANNIAFPVKPLSIAVGNIFQVVPTSGSPITTAAYTEVSSGTGFSTSEIEIDNTTGVTLIVAFGSPGGEVDTFFVFAKGLSRQAISIPAGTRISLKATGNNATYGEVNFNTFM